MKKTNFFALMVLLGISTCALGVGGNMGGTDPNGSPEKPYLIEDIDDFDTFADPNNAATYWASGVHTKLTTDIDLSGRTYTTAIIASETDWRLGGFQGAPYAGIFDGNGYSLSNVTINFPHGHYVGIFGYVGSDGEIRNLDAKKIDVLGSSYVGGLAGYNEGNINSCSASGLMLGGGGLVGFNQGSISDSFASVSLTAGGGGLVGENYQGIISSCYATGDITGYFVGGLVGSNSEGTINQGVIHNCYATGSVTALAPMGAIAIAGGLVGSTIGGEISYCYSIGKVDGPALGNIGGLIGSEHYEPTFINNFWDREASGTGDGVGDEEPDPAGIIGLTTSEMMTQSTFTGWDFSMPVWMMLRPGEDYPRLAWQEIFDGDIAGLYGVDLVDFAYLANYWGQDCDSPECDRADIDESGDVGIGDLVYVAQDWLK